MLVLKCIQNDLKSNIKMPVGFLSIFQSLEKALLNCKFQVKEQSLMDNIESFIKKYNEFI